MPGDILGYVTKEAAEATGFPQGLPVVATSNDKAVEGLGTGCMGDTTACISLGTYTAAMMEGKENLGYKMRMAEVLLRSEQIPL